MPNHSSKREAAIRSRLTSVPAVLLDDAVAHGLAYAAKWPARLGLAAAVGLYIANKQHSLSYSVEEIAEIVQVESRLLRRRISKLSGLSVHYKKFSQNGSDHSDVQFDFLVVDHQEASNPRTVSRSALKLTHSINRRARVTTKRKTVTECPHARILGLLAQDVQEEVSHPQPMLLLQQEQDLLNSALDIRLYNYF